MTEFINYLKRTEPNTLKIYKNKTMKKLITLCLLLATIFTTQAQQNINEIINNCPTPTRDQFQGVCGSIFRKDGPSEESGLGYEYQEDLYEISCVDKSDSKEVAYQKIRNMWIKNRENFLCYNFTGVSRAYSNVAIFSIDTGFSTFLVTAVKKYKLDMNFKDRNGETIMDFLLYGIEKYKNSKYTEKYEEYERIYKLLEAYGTKHAKDL